jgi:hypothetical protein
MRNKGIIRLLDLLQPQLFLQRFFYRQKILLHFLNLLKSLEIMNLCWDVWLNSITSFGLAAVQTDLHIVAEEGRWVFFC